MRGTLFRFWAPPRVGRGGLIWVSLLSPDFSRQVGWPSVGFASRFSDYQSQLVNGTCRLVDSRQNLPTHSFTDQGFVCPDLYIFSALTVSRDSVICSVWKSMSKKEARAVNCCPPLCGRV